MKSRIRSSLKWLALIIIAFAFATLNHPVYGDCRPEGLDYGCKPTQNDYSQEEAHDCSPELTDTEEYVLKQVLSGKPVKFAEYRQISGCFLKNLLAGSKGKVPDSGVMIDKANVVGPLDLRNSEIPFRVELTCCFFKGDVNLRRSHFARGLSFAGSTFGSSLEGPGRLDAKFATIDFDFNLNDCIFNNACTFLNGIGIKNDWWLRRVWFAGKVDFTGATINADLFADKEHDNDPPTHFHNVADFEFVKVGQDCRLNDVVFDGFVGFGNADFRTLQLTKATFNGNVTFRSSKIDSVYLTEAPNFKKLLTIEDMTFKYMSPQDWDQLERIAALSNNDNKSNNAQFYSNLEQLFRIHGQSNQADKVYIAWKEKERPSLPWYWRLLDYPEDWLVGYGRHSERVLGLIILFVAFGNIVFRSESNMHLKRPEDTKVYANRYNGFWYSLDLFIPVIGLGAAEIWTPKDKPRVWYKYAHRIAGYLLVTIILASWTVAH